MVKAIVSGMVMMVIGAAPAFAVGPAVSLDAASLRDSMQQIANQQKGLRDRGVYEALRAALLETSTPRAFVARFKATVALSDCPLCSALPVVTDDQSAAIQAGLLLNTITITREVMPQFDASEVTNKVRALASNVVGATKANRSRTFEVLRDYEQRLVGAGQQGRLHMLVGAAASLGAGADLKNHLAGLLNGGRVAALADANLSPIYYKTVARAHQAYLASGVTAAEALSMTRTLAERHRVVALQKGYALQLVDKFPTQKAAVIDAFRAGRIEVPEFR